MEGTPLTETVLLLSCPTAIVTSVITLNVSVSSPLAVCLCVPCTPSTYPRAKQIANAVE